ncbi:MAG: hypothetical protein ACREQ9_00885, partial [Candidatus Binatia bacterium]
MNREMLAIGLLVALGLAASAAAQPSFEVNVSNDPAVKDGEPSLAQNPKDRANLVMGYMKEVGRNLEEAGECAAAATFDGGVTWETQVLPLTDSLFTICADPTIIFAGDGTAYFAAIAFNPTFQVGHTVVTRSADGGVHWSAPVEAVGPASLAATLGDGSTAAIDGFDRPWLAYDAASGKLHLTTMTIFSRPMGPLAHRYLVSSADKGETWGTIRVVDSPEYPADHWATGTIAIGADGMVAIAYTARRVPEPGMPCPCAVLATTRDGESFTRHTVPFPDAMLGVNLPDQGEPSLLRLVYGPVLAADPTRPGRYAVAVAAWKGLGPYTLGRAGVVPATRVEVKISRTDDAGATWSAPVALGEDPAKDREHVWMAYSPSGALGLTWRTHQGPCCFGSTEVWSVVSPDGGAIFDPPRKMSHAPSPFTE